MVQQQFAGFFTETSAIHRDQPATKQRREWSPAARDQICGPEPERVDPVPAHRAATQNCRAIVHEAYGRAELAVTADESTGTLAEILTPVAGDAGEPTDAPMRVVLLGSTMAGKSTLLSALTGASAERISDGRQRYSRDAFAAPALNLLDVEIVDTPGVGAKDGQDDVAAAMAQVAGADLVVWVAPNNSFQEETAQALREVALRGKPVVIVLNCRQPITNDFERDDFLDDPGQPFAQSEGHLATIRSHLSSVAIRPVAEVAVHAEAARQGLSDSEWAGPLLEASRFEALLAVLAREAGEGRTARRLVREADEIRTDAVGLASQLAEVEQRIRTVVAVGRETREEYAPRAARLIEAFQSHSASDVARIVSRRHDWLQTITEFGPGAQTLWAHEQAELTSELDNALETRRFHLARALDEARVATETESTAAVRRHTEITGLRDFRGLWLRRVVGIAVGGGGALAAAALVIGVGAVAGPVAGPLGATVAGTVVSSLVPALRKKVQSLFVSKAQILEQNRVRIRRDVGEFLADLEAQVLAEVRGVASQVNAELKRVRSRGERAEEAALEVADLVANQRIVVDEAIRVLDDETVRCLLQAAGRSRLAASMMKATRLPGVCIAVEVHDESLAEAWLFPPSAPELMTFGRPPLPGNPGTRALSYVLGLTEELPQSVGGESPAFTVLTAASVPDEVRSAWSAALSDHLNSPVEIVRSNSTRSTTCG